MLATGNFLRRFKVFFGFFSPFFCKTTLPLAFLVGKKGKTQHKANEGAKTHGESDFECLGLCVFCVFGGGVISRLNGKFSTCKPKFSMTLPSEVGIPMCLVGSAIALATGSCRPLCLCQGLCQFLCQAPLQSCLEIAKFFGLFCPTPFCTGIPWVAHHSATPGGPACMPCSPWTPGHDIAAKSKK